jgi:hypothetical protein
VPFKVVWAAGVRWNEAAKSQWGISACEQVWHGRPLPLCVAKLVDPGE